MPKIGKILPELNGTGLEVLVVTLFLSLKLLLDSNMGQFNEVDVLPLARQYVDPSWIPGDWYLNQPPGYRLLFDLVFGRLIVAWDFLTASIIGRILCYGLSAIGLVLIARKLGLKLPLLLLAIAVLLNVDYVEGVAAHEWLWRALEAKTVAYGFVLLGIWQLLQSRYRWMALMLGLATSFHVLVGGWTFLVALAWLVVRQKIRIGQIRTFGSLILIYLAASVFALKAVVDQLFAAVPNSPVPPSYIYVFLRLPHHLNPLSWSPKWWIKPALYVLALAVSIVILRWQKPDAEKQSEQFEQHQARMALFEFTLVSLVPFLLGLAIAPFDVQGNLLQFYPFRLGDVMLPLDTCLLSACALQQLCTGHKQKILTLICIGLLTVLCCFQAVTFQKQVLALSQFPKVDPEFKALCNWVRTQTPPNATVVTSPVSFVDFTGLAERPTIAKYQLLPQGKAGLVNWYERLSNLGGGSFPQPTKIRTRDRRDKIKQALTRGYNHLTTAQVNALMNQYAASYFMTLSKQRLDLPIAYRSPHYVIYSKPAAKI